MWPSRARQPVSPIKEGHTHETPVGVQYSRYADWPAGYLRAAYPFVLGEPASQQASKQASKQAAAAAAGFKRRTDGRTAAKWTRSQTHTHTHTTRLGQLHFVVARPDRNSTLARRGQFVRSFVRWNGKHRHRQDAFATGIPGFHTYLRPTDFKSQNPAWEYICQSLCTVCTVRTRTQRASAGERARRRETKTDEQAKKTFIAFASAWMDPNGDRSFCSVLPPPPPAAAVVVVSAHMANVCLSVCCQTLLKKGKRNKRNHQA
ncbi:hypothetical protein BKA81DRAFT_26342 [Phyllosticta paracitricarpa]|uniref:Uncharacterized protein n=1 Tax=Phyllosticta paracitricarpa TaxID=2016321 RepID=A0ABR1NJ19_9PEZI